MAILLAFETYSLLIGDAAPEDVEAKIRDAVIADKAVTGIAGLYTMHVGPRAILVVLEVRFRRDLTIPGSRRPSGDSKTASARPWPAPPRRGWS